MRPQEKHPLRSGLPEYSPRHLSPETCLRLFPPVTVTNDNGKRPYVEASEDTAGPSENDLASQPAPRPTKKVKPNQRNNGVETRDQRVSEGPKNSGNSMPPQPAPCGTERPKENQGNATDHSGPQSKGEFGLYFSNIAEVKRDNGVVFQPPPDNTLPKSDEERQALVKRLVDAIQHVDPVLTDPNAKAPPKAFQNRWMKRTYYTAVQIEKVGWEILHETEQLYTHGWSWAIYDSGLISSIKATSNCKFQERIDDIVSLLQVAKKVCESVLKGEKLRTVIGIPKSLKSSSETNKKQNAKKQFRIDLGKKAEPNNRGDGEDVSTTAPAEEPPLATQSPSADPPEGSPDSAMPATIHSQEQSALHHPKQPYEVIEDVPRSVQHSPVQSAEPGCVYSRESTPVSQLQPQFLPPSPGHKAPVEPHPDVSDANFAGVSTQEEGDQTEYEVPLGEGGCSIPETSNLTDTLGDQTAPQNIQTTTEIDELNLHHEAQGTMSFDEDAATPSGGSDEHTSPGGIDTFNYDHEYNDPSSRNPSQAPSLTEGDSPLSQSFLEELDDLLDRGIALGDAERSPQPARFKDKYGGVYQAAPGWTTIKEDQIPEGFTPLNTCGSKRPRGNDDGYIDQNGTQQGPRKKKTCRAKAQPS